MEPQQSKIESVVAPLKKVTPLSRYLAMALFVILPFIGGWIGYTYMTVKVITVEVIANVNDGDLSESEDLSVIVTDQSIKPVNIEIQHTTGIEERCLEEYSARKGHYFYTKASGNLYFRPYPGANFMLTLPDALRKDEYLPCMFWITADSLIYNSPQTKENVFYYYGNLYSNLLLVKRTPHIEGPLWTTYRYSPSEKTILELGGYKLYDKIADNVYVQYVVDREILKLHILTDEGYEVKDALVLNPGETFNADCDGKGCTHEISYSVIYDEGKLDHEFKADSVKLKLSINIYTTEKPDSIRPVDLGQYLLRQEVIEFEF